jgi:hypothetical protein
MRPMAYEERQATRGGPDDSGVSGAGPIAPDRGSTIGDARHLKFLVSAVAVCLCAGGLATTPALAKSGLTLARTAARPGDAVAFRGGSWIICCPTGPFSRVTVFLERGHGRWLIGSARPSASGAVAGLARIPRVPAGRYSVEACGLPPKGSGLKFPVCVPAQPGSFLVRRPERRATRAEGHASRPSRPAGMRGSRACASYAVVDSR